MEYYTGLFAGVPLVFGFRYPGTAGYYQDWLKKSDTDHNCVTVPANYVEYWSQQWHVSDYAYAEFVYSSNYACDALMKHGRIVLHGASFLWKGYAYIFSAPSGTGKTTQIRLWKELYPEEMEIMNGDKPILEVSESGVHVHPSPWKGKEEMGRDDRIAPLGGIILLKQDKTNSIKELQKGEAARMLFGRLYSTFTTEEDVIAAGRLLEQILNQTPVYLLQNKGDQESAVITHDFLKSGDYEL